MTIKKLSKEIRHQLLQILVPFLGIIFFYVVGKTSRVKIIGQEAHDAIKAQYPHVIYVGWHEHVITSGWILRQRNIALMVSQSRDGEYLARLNRLLGFYTVRGSSTRGGIRGFLQLAKVLQRDHDVLIGVDGPRGPARECKAGAVLLAKKTGLPIIPLGGRMTRFTRVKSWDRTIIPFPFSTFLVGYGEPIFVPKDADKQMIAKYQIRVKDAINALA